MRPWPMMLAALALAAPLQASIPSPSDVETIYTSYRAAICSSTCPAGFDDFNARLFLLIAYCRSNGTGVDCSAVNKWSTPPTLTFDHNQRDWVADASLAPRTQEDVNGIPTVSVGRQEEVVAVVDHTNPLLYSAAGGNVTLQPIEQFSDLQKLAGLIGGNVSALLQVRAAEGAVLGMSGGTLKEAADLFADAGKAYVAAQDLTDCVALHVQAATNFVQAVELGRTGQYPRDPPSCQNVTVNGAAVRALTPSLAGARAVLARRCSTLTESVAALLETDPTDTKAVSKALEKYEAAKVDPNCAAWQTPPDVVTEVDTKIIDRIKHELALPSPDLPALFQDLTGAPPGSDVPELARMVKAVKAVEDPLVKLLASLPAFGKAAENLDGFRERLLRNVTSNLVPCDGDASKRCVPQDAVASAIVVPGGATRVTRWESVHTRPIKIAIDSPYSGDLRSVRPPVETSYNLRSSLASIFDVGVSVTKTDLQSPVFGAVRVDDGDGNLANDKKVVGIVDQEGQSGKLAVMLNVVPLRLWNKAPTWLQPLGIQIGAGADSSKPGLFGGFSYGLGKYARIGWGWTSQRVSTLRDETPEGKQIADASEIRKRQKYQEDHYWSLMVSVRALRLFATP
jgi:hypothetical protein